MFVIWIYLEQVQPTRLHTSVTCDLVYNEVKGLMEKPEGEERRR